MRFSAARVRVAVVLSGAILVSCSEGPSTPLLDAESRSLLLSHSPAHHGVTADVLPAVVPDYTSLDAAAMDQRGGSLQLMVDAAGAIPRFPEDYILSVAVFGYAWADLDTGRGIVSVIHPVIGRDSKQNPDGWHTHPVQLTAGTSDSDFCVVEIGRSQGGIAIRDDVMRVHMPTRWAGISAAALDVAAAFIVRGDTGCTGTELGVVVLGAATP